MYFIRVRWDLNLPYRRVHQLFFGTIFILLLLLRLTQWLHMRHNLVMLTYAITMGAIILNFASGMIYLIDELENDPNVIRPLPFPPHVLHVEKGDGSLKNLYLVTIQ